LRDTAISVARRVVRDCAAERQRYDCARRVTFRRSRCVRALLCHTM